MGRLTGLKGHWDDIQDHDGNLLLRKEFDNTATNTTRSPSHDNYLLFPIIFVLHPVVQNARAKVIVYPSCKPEVK